MVIKPEWLSMEGPAALYTLASLAFITVMNAVGAYWALRYARRYPMRRQRRQIKRVRDSVYRASNQYEVGNYDRAEKYLSRALGACRAGGDVEGEADQLGNLGLVLSRKGDSAGAEECFERALELYRSIGDAVGVANQMANLSVARERVEITGASLKTPRREPAEEVRVPERAPVRVRRVRG